VVGVLGALANIVNIIVFAKQSFNSSVNVNLLCLSIADFGSLASLSWKSLSYIHVLLSWDLSYLGTDVIYVLAAVSRGTFTRIAWWITTLITFERCLCIAMPLKIKHIVTPRSSTLALCLILLVALAGVSPFLIARRIGDVSTGNSTAVGFYYAENGPYLESISTTYSVVAQLGSYILNAACTGVIILQLRVKSTWRKGCGLAVGLNHARELRDKRIAKMISSISSLFIVCSFANCVSLVLVIAKVPGYSDAFASPTFLAVQEATITLEAVSSSVTNLVYYSMSSKYRETFDETFLHKTESR
ncbi:unnamed protein product, partial [Lymnaea stagnalis]